MHIDCGRVTLTQKELTLYQAVCKRLGENLQKIRGEGGGNKKQILEKSGATLEPTGGRWHERRANLHGKAYRHWLSNRRCLGEKISQQAWFLKSKCVSWHREA